jgi:hypothetical protein
MPFRMQRYQTNRPGLRRPRAARLASALACAALSGCGTGALPTSYNGPVTGSIAAANAQAIAAASTGLSEIHSTTCPGLEIERQERLRRIAKLQTTVTAELASAPTTLAHAMQRAGPTPEEGTLAYQEIMAERTYLASVAVASAKQGCPPTDPGKEPSKP